MVGSLKIWYLTKNAHLFEEQSRQISSRPDLKLRSLEVFEQVAPKKKNNKNNNIKMSIDVRSVPWLSDN